MAKSIVKPRTAVRPKTKRPPLYKVILLNDDYTPREFVVLVLKAVFRMNEDEAYRVMMTAHRRGACVIAVYAKDVAETKAKGRQPSWASPKGIPCSSPPSPRNRRAARAEQAACEVANGGERIARRRLRDATSLAIPAPLSAQHGLHRLSKVL